MQNYEEKFHDILETPSKRQGPKQILHASYIETPVGPMMGIADEEALYFLEFVDREGIERSVEKLKEKTKSVVFAKTVKPLESIKNELEKYFAGNLKEFKTPLFFQGSRFQNRVWQALQKIPFGETRSYADIAVLLKKPTAYRAVARANATNWLVLIVPCHRVINSSGAIGGYGGGIDRKEWLLNHEKLKKGI